MKYRTVNGQTLDEIVWRHYGDVPGVIELVLEANPGLANHGDILPPGIVIDLQYLFPGFASVCGSINTALLRSSVLRPLYTHVDNIRICRMNDYIRDMP